MKVGKGKGSGLIRLSIFGLSFFRAQGWGVVEKGEVWERAPAGVV